MQKQHDFIVERAKVVWLKQVGQQMIAVSDGTGFGSDYESIIPWHTR